MIDELKELKFKESDGYYYLILSENRKRIEVCKTRNTVTIFNLNNCYSFNVPYKENILTEILKTL